MDKCFSDRSDGQSILNVVFLFNLYEVDILMDDSKYVLVLPSGDVTYRKNYRLFKAYTIPMQRYSGIWHIAQIHDVIYGGLGK